MKTIKDNNDIATLIGGANKLAELMFNFFKENKSSQPFTFGTVGYATELFMRFMAEQAGEDYDKLSVDYANYLREVHEDVKRMSVENPKAN